MSQRLSAGHSFLFLSVSESGGSFTIGFGEAPPEGLVHRGAEFVAPIFLSQQIASCFCADAFLEFKKKEADAYARLGELLDSREDGEQTSEGFQQSFSSETLAEKSLEFDFGTRVFGSLERMLSQMWSASNSPFTDHSPWQGPGSLSMEEIRDNLYRTVDFLKGSWPKSVVRFVESRVYDVETANMVLTPTGLLEGLRQSKEIDVSLDKSRAGSIAHHECQVSVPFRMLATNRSGNFGPMTSSVLSAMDMAFGFASSSPPETVLRDYQKLRGEILGLFQKFESLLSGMSL